MAMPLTSLRNKLKTLCTFGDCGWSYAIFWRFHPRNSLLLSFEEAYFEEQLGEDIVNKLPQVHLLGEGIVGEAAFMGKHSWVHSDAQTQEWNFSAQNISEDNSRLKQQFSFGIKTIVVIPVRACGVVLFGSKKKIFENVEFLNKTQSLLMETDDTCMLDVSGSAVSSLDFENNDLNEFMPSLPSGNSHDWNLIYTQDENSQDLMRNIYSSLSPYDPFASGYKTQEEGMNSLQGSSSCLDDQLKATTETQVEVVKSEKDNSDLLLNPNSSMNCLTAQNSCFDTLSGEVSEVWAQEAENALSSREFVVQDSALASTNKGSFQNSMDNQNSCQSSVVTNVESFEPLDMSEEFMNFTSMDDLYQWFSSSPEKNQSLYESIEFNPTSFDLVGNNSSSYIPEPVTSSIMNSSENSVLDSAELDQTDEIEWWKNLLMLTDNGFSECISELNTDTQTETRKRLFSELGIEGLIKGETDYTPSNSTNFESNKKQMVDFSSLSRNSDSVHFTNLAMPEARVNLMQPISELEKMRNLLSKKNVFPKVEGGMWTDDKRSINIARKIPGHPQNPKEPEKPSKKRAKPGESARPRPKDRQQIQDCIQKLREIIPHGGKCSIDSLLSRTIKYMIFLQSVQNYSDKLQEPNEPMLIEDENGLALKDNQMGDSANGATWALEVGNQTMLCPIIVKEMNQPGRNQMLVEMLCEDQGFFLEIVDKVRSLGLNILKAKMETRKNKLWTRLIVEADRHVTRLDVFCSLMHLLQQTNTSGIDSANKHCNLLDADISSPHNYQKPNDATNQFLQMQETRSFCT